MKLKDKTDYITLVPVESKEDKDFNNELHDYIIRRLKKWALVTQKGIPKLLKEVKKERLVKRVAKKAKKKC